MGISLRTARWLAPASLAYDFCLQQYGMFSTPNMKSIHDANLSFFSPQPYLIAAFFFPQQLLQLAWLYKLHKLRASAPADKQQLDEMLRFAPYCALANACIGTWALFWTASQLQLAALPLALNAAVQLWVVFTQLAPLDPRAPGSVLTHAVAKTFAGIGVLDLLHNTSAAWFRGALPSTPLKVATGLGFAGLSACSDWILGGCLVYDLVALSVGQRAYEQDWSWVLGGFAFGCAAIVAVRNYFRPPYVRKNDYASTAQDDVDDRA